MQIEENNNTIEFKNVNAGECFKKDNILYIRTTNIIGTCTGLGTYLTYNSINVLNGTFKCFNSTDMVSDVNKYKVVKC